MSSPPVLLLAKLYWIKCQTAYYNNKCYSFIFSNNAWLHKMSVPSMTLPFFPQMLRVTLYLKFKPKMYNDGKFPNNLEAYQTMQGSFSVVPLVLACFPLPAITSQLYRAGCERALSQRHALPWRARPPWSWMWVLSAAILTPNFGDPDWPSKNISKTDNWTFPLRPHTQLNATF